MLLNIKNTSVKEDPAGVLDTRSIFICQVLGIEGDPSWEIMRKELLDIEGNNDGINGLTYKRTIDKGTGRIIFRLPEKDNLKIANPLLSRVYNIFPMVGEIVKVIAYDIADNDLCYDYIGPIIPSLINANNSLNAIGKRNLDTYGNFSDIDPIIDFQGLSNDVKQIYPTTQDIAIQGRGGSQILIRKVQDNFNNPNEYIVIRSGIFLKNSNDKVPTYNEKESFIKTTTEPDPKIGMEYMLNNKYQENTNYIQHIYKSKYDPDAKTTPIQSNEIKTRVDIVAEKINLFTYPNNRETTYGIPYAELFAEYLSYLQNWLINHQHGTDGKTAQNLAQKLGENLSITDKGYITIPGKGSKLALTKDIKIV
jgi:hypothetical protein